MRIKNTKRKGHSEDFFGAYRDFWWNESFLKLLARRLQLNTHQHVLDVGCGQCHWSRLLAGYFSKTTKIVGVDNDRKWSKGEDDIKGHFDEIGIEFELKKGDAHHLPFEDNSFDLVTCQTLLIHVENPNLVISEMKRVLKPGGTILCVEPNNLVQSLTKSSISVDDPVQEVLDHVKYAVLFERGKKKLGLGDNSLGDLVPGYLAKVGFENVEVRLSDKAIPMYPPYNTKEQVATMKQWQNGNTWSNPEFSDFDYFKAMGKESLDFFENYRQKYAYLGERMLKNIDTNKYHSAGGAMMYVISATKPES